LYLPENLDLSWCSPALFGLTPLKRVSLHVHDTGRVGRASNDENNDDFGGNVCLGCDEESEEQKRLTEFEGSPGKISACPFSR
ncbi:MAG: hypothetical protein WB622_18405, partial [Acidobacteriaceae bacterium]